MRPFGGEADALAATALYHLQQDFARTPINYDLIVWDIHLITALSVNDAIRIPLLNQQSMTILTSVINSMVDRYATTNRHTLVAKCLSYGYWYIRAYVESSDGLPWVTQIVEAGLLSAMLSTEPWIKHLGDQDSEDWEPLFLLLGQIIPKYSVYNSVLKPMIRRLTAIDACGLPGKLEKDGWLFQSWSLFENVVRSRAALYTTTLRNETHIESCQNTKVCHVLSARLCHLHALLYSVTSPDLLGHSKAAQGASTFIIAAKNVKCTIGRMAATKSIAVTSKLVVQVSERTLRTSRH